MAGDRDLTPDDAVVALRSFPRRFRGVFARPDDDDDRVDPDEAARRPGADGVTAAEHLGSAIGLVRSAGDVARSRHVAALPTTGPDNGRPLPELLDELDIAADDAAERVDAVPSGDWTSDVLHAVQDAVGAVASHLRAAQSVMTEVG